MTWNDLQRARNDLKQSTTSKKQPTTTWDYLQRAKKDTKRPTASRFWDYCIIRRSSHRRCSVRKGVLRNFAKFTGKHLCQSLLFNKVAGLRPVTLLKRRLLHRCFLQSTSGRLLLNMGQSVLFSNTFST